MPNRRYRLMQAYKTPTTIIAEGTLAGENHWQNIFPSLLGKDLSGYPSWFQEIKDEPQEATTNEGFKWDDELIKEFLTNKFDEIRMGNIKWSIIMDDFKQSKQSHKQDSSKEINEVKYTQSDLDAAQKEAFEAGKERDLERPLISTYPPNSAIKELTLYADKYPTYNDYKNRVK